MTTLELAERIAQAVCEAEHQQLFANWVNNLFDNAPTVTSDEPGAQAVLRVLREHGMRFCRVNEYERPGFTVEDQS